MNKTIKVALGITAISAGSLGQCYGYGLGLLSELSPSSIAAVAVTSSSTSFGYGGAVVYNTITDEAIQVDHSARYPTAQT
jgi:hypothetical protein